MFGDSLKWKVFESILEKENLERNVLFVVGKGTLSSRKREKDDDNKIDSTQL
jgi:hypothetical protein